MIEHPNDQQPGARTLAERIKREHTKVLSENGDFCHQCGQDWPCDAIQLAEAVLAQPGEHWKAEHGTDGHVCDQSCAPSADASTAGDAIDIVFDGPPSREPPSFVEVENMQGESIRVGEWIDRGDGLWALRIPGRAPSAASLEDVAREIADEVCGRYRVIDMDAKGHPVVIAQILMKRVLPILQRHRLGAGEWTST